jgi:hypothetical protein
VEGVEILEVAETPVEVAEERKAWVHYCPKVWELHEGVCFVAVSLASLCHWHFDGKQVLMSLCELWQPLQKVLSLK